VQTRLSRICDAIIEAGWLAALIVTPLFFNTFSNRVFEPDKLHLLRSIALVMAVAWLVQLLDSGFRRQPGGPGLWSRLRTTPLVLPTLVLVISYLLSTALSVVPRISFFGSYVRMQGTWSYLSYVAIFAMVLTHVRSRAQVNRIFYAVIMTSLPIAIYGILQHGVGGRTLDPLPWGGDVVERVAANMGNSIFVAAYLIMAVFLTLERLLDSLAAIFNTEQGSIADSLRAGAYFFILAVQIIAIVFTQSRGPWGGLLAGLYVFAMLGLLLLARWAQGRTKLPKAFARLTRNVRTAWLGLIGLTLAVLIVLGVLNVPLGPLSGLCQQRYVGRLCTVFSTTQGTNAVRALIWEGVVDLMLKPHAPIQSPDGQPDPLNVIRPLVGYGPESMWVAYNRFYPPNLAHYEARNASPDRSHNETFDTLVRGGLIQFAAQIFLYASIFYYSLRWLGLMRGRKRRNLFIASLVAGGALGVIVPLILDGSLRLAGVGLPAGLVAGMIVYVTLDLLLSGGGELQERAGGSGGQTSGRRQLLILVLFAAIVAHFVEVHFGIAIASTLTLFWVLAGVLVTVGMGWVEEEGQAKAEVQVKTEAAAIRPQPAGAKAQPAAAAAGKPKAGKPSSHSQDTRQTPGSQTTTRLPVPLPARPPRPLRQLLPYVMIGALITLVLTWDFIPMGVPTGATTPGAFLWDAFTSRSNAAAYTVVRSPMLLVMMIFTWLIGGVLAAAESARRQRWAAGLAIYFGATFGTWLIYGLVESSRMTRVDLSDLDVFRHIAGHVVLFDILLFVLTFTLAAALAFADRRPRPAQVFGRMPVLSLGVGLGALVLALVLIVNTNIQTVQADTYYKQGMAYEGAGQWEGAVVLYNEAAKLEPQEDYYYLFLGRALLQLADMAQTGNALLPADLSNVPTRDLLGLSERGARSGTREDLMRAAQAALVAAQRLNPLNTDHSANLARLSRAWAFADALSPDDNPTDTRLREILATPGNKVDQARLDQALTYYQQATALSPQNAQLWNELATVQFIQNDLAGAQTSINRSLALDQRFAATHLLQGDVRDAAGDKQGALAAFRQAGQLAPNDLVTLSSVGVFSAETGDLEGAADSFAQIIRSATKAQTSAQTRLDTLEQFVAQSGGYDRLQSSAAAERDALKRRIASYDSQLHLAYRNLALVLRDAGRPAEALEAAQQALTYAGDDTDKAEIESLIADLKQKLNQ
jgi:tetratricopeptide (TPR) repeat protein